MHYPKADVVVLRNCPKPPTRIELATMLETEATKKGLTLGMDKSHMPDTRWMLMSLATLNPKHRIFDKSYQPQIKDKKTAE